MEEYLLEHGIEYKADTPLAFYNTSRIGGIAKLICFPSNEKELILILKYVKENNIKNIIFANGSNIIFDDKEFDGLAICLKKINLYYDCIGESLDVGAGYNVITLNNELAKHDIGGLEFMSGIPASIGGVIYMNAGAYKEEVKDHLLEVTFIDENLNLVKYNNEQCRFGYRHSVFQDHPEWIIVSAFFKIECKPSGVAQEIIKRRKITRSETQPLDLPSFGSTFKNISPELSAWYIIDEIGMRGYSVGGVKFSEKHSNFLVNYNNGTCKDVEEIIQIAKEKAWDKFGVKLETEVKIIKW